MLYDPPDETEHNYKDERNYPKYGDGSKKKKKMSESFASIKISSTWKNRILQMQLF